MKFAQSIKVIVRWAQHRLTKKQFILLSSVLVAVSSALAAIVLKTFAHLIFVMATTLDNSLKFKYFFLILPLLGILLTVVVIRKLLKGKFEKRISQILYSIAKRSSLIPKEQMYAQIITSSLTVGLGGSAGLESPIVITGAAFGSNYARTYRLSYKDRTLLLGCGVAAGIAAAFNAPVAGLLFTLEVLLVDVSISAFIPLIIAAATGALISKIILRDNILLSFQLQQPFNYHNVPFYIILGIMAGFVSVYHARTFVKLESLFSKNKEATYRNVFTGGLILIALIFVFPSLFGEGYESIKVLSSQKPEVLLENTLFSSFIQNEWFVLFFVGIVMLVKVFATAMTIGSGGNGGNFAPSLFVGAYLGFFLSRFINLLDLTKLPETNFTIVGMAGLLSGIFYAPLTAIFLIAEITGGYTLMIPLMIVSSLSFAISKYFEPYSMDTKKLAEEGQIFTHDKDKNILNTIKTSGLVETDFLEISATDKLGDLVKHISNSKRNIFPVTDSNKRLLGIILLDSVRDIIFKHELYDTISVSELMINPPDIILSNETMETVMKKFDENGAWNLPVIDDEKYIGFISKSSVFSIYRNKLITSTIE